MSNPERPPVESFITSLFRRHPVATAIISIVVFLVWTFPIGFAQAWPAFVKDKTIPEWLAERRWPGMTAQLYGWLTIAFFLTLAILLVAIIIVSRRRGTPAEAPPAARQVPVADVEQQDRIKELEEEKAALERAIAKTGEQHRIEIGRLQHSEQTHSIRAAMNQNLLDQNKWLHELARMDRERMSHLVVVESCEPINHNLESADAPFIEYRVTVLNASVYPIRIEESVKGRMSYREPNYILATEPSITVNEAESVAHGNRGRFHLYQWLTPHECDLIRRFTAEFPNQPYYTKLNLEKVGVYFTAKYQNGTEEAFNLKLPPTIDLPLFKGVPPNLGVNELKARIEELERENEELKTASNKPEKRSAKKESILGLKEGIIGITSQRPYDFDATKDDELVAAVV